jgi:hypothetical protein
MKMLKKYSMGADSFFSRKILSSNPNIYMLFIIVCLGDDPKFRTVFCPVYFICGPDVSITEWQTDVLSGEETEILQISSLL